MEFSSTDSFAQMSEEPPAALSINTWKCRSSIAQSYATTQQLNCYADMPLLVPTNMQTQPLTRVKSDSLAGSATETLHVLAAEVQHNSDITNIRVEKQKKSLMYRF